MSTTSWEGAMMDVLTRKIYRNDGFNSRPSCDGRPGMAICLPSSVVFQFTPVLRRATSTRQA